MKYNELPSRLQYACEIFRKYLASYDEATQQDYADWFNEQDWNCKVDVVLDNDEFKLTIMTIYEMGEEPNQLFILWDNFGFLSQITQYFDTNFSVIFQIDKMTDEPMIYNISTQSFEPVNLRK